MQLNSATRTSRASEQADRPIQRGIDYDRYYRVLDLLPGAPLGEIEDRLWLLHDAFNSDALPSVMKSPAEERSKRIEQAAHELRDYWTAHGEAPPSTDLRGTEGLFDALVEVLAGSVEGAAAGQSTRAISSGAASLPVNGSDVRGSETGAAVDPQRTAKSAPLVPPGTWAIVSKPGNRVSDPRETFELVRTQLAPQLLPALPTYFQGRNQPVFTSRPGYNSGVQRVEIALQVVHHHVHVQPECIRAPISEKPSVHHSAARPALTGPNAAAEREPGNSALASANEARVRRTGSMLLSIIVFAVAMALAVWLQLYNWGWAVPGAGRPSAAMPTPRLSSFTGTAPRTTEAFLQPHGRGHHPPPLRLAR